MEYCCSTAIISLNHLSGVFLFVWNDWHYLGPTLSPCRRWASIALMSVFNLNIWDSTRAFSRCNSVISASKVNRSSPPFPILQSKNHNFFTFSPPQHLPFFLKIVKIPQFYQTKTILILFSPLWSCFEPYMWWYNESAAFVGMGFLPEAKFGADGWQTLSVGAPRWRNGLGFKWDGSQTVCSDCWWWCCCCCSLAMLALCCSTVPPLSSTRILLRLAIGHPDALKLNIINYNSYW